MRLGLGVSEKAISLFKYNYTESPDRGDNSKILPLIALGLGYTF
jgi:hypothetical protein